MEKIKLDLPVIVEGRYDRQKLASVADCEIITTDGFGIFSDEEKKKYISRVAVNGIYVLTDSDSAGRLIRSHLRSFLPADRIINIYVPAIKGKEKRKSAPSADGLLGVEGTETGVLRGVLEKYAVNVKKNGITKTDLYGMGLSGGENSSRLRDDVSVKLGLPPGLSCNAFLDAVNRLTDLETLGKICTEAENEDFVAPSTRKD